MWESHLENESTGLGPSSPSRDSVEVSYLLSSSAQTTGEGGGRGEEEKKKKKKQLLWTQLFWGDFFLYTNRN